LAAESDVITLHCPLTPETYHLVNAQWLKKVKPCCMIVNTSRGALIDTRAVIHALKTERLGSLGLDVYEEEEDLFFEDLSERVIQDDVFARLLTFPNVLITAHQGFFTREAMNQIAGTTLSNIREFEDGKPLTNEVLAERAVRQK
jgi:D-lactate dehydrogenase